MVTKLTAGRNSAGIFTYLNEYDQNLENKKYVDIWLNDSGINSGDFRLHIDLGLMSEDANQNDELDSEEIYISEMELLKKKKIRDSMVVLMNMKTVRGDVWELSLILMENQQ